MARYRHGQSLDEPLIQERAGQAYFYHRDHLGSVRLVTDAAGAVVNSYDYDAYGNFEAISETVTSPYAYTGREYDGESGLYYYRKRYYDPRTGRFLQQDPLGFAAGDSNHYRYVFNDPVNLVDPFGLQAANEDAALRTLALGLGIGTVGVAFNNLIQNIDLSLDLPPLLPSSADGGGSGSGASGSGGSGGNSGPGNSGPGNSGPGAAAGPRSGPAAAPGTASTPPDDPENDPRCGGPGGAPEDRFSREPKTIQDRLALDEAKTGAGSPVRKMPPLSDPRYLGWIKMQHIVTSVEGAQTVIHYARDPKTGKLADFKFKKHSTGEVCP